jgi:FAD/FMN-containing dehydrogenase
VDALRPPEGFSGEFRTDLTARALYSEGAGPLRILPVAVALPRDRADLGALVRYAADVGVPLTPRGGGTGMPGNNVGRGIVVDLAAFDRPARVALAGTANMGAAVTCAVLDRIAGHFHLRLPPDPSSAIACTIGGMVATNAAGARSFSKGSIRRWVRGVELLTADGEVGWLGRERSRRISRYPTPEEQRALAAQLQLEDRFAPVAGKLDAARDEIGRHFPHTPKNSAGYALDAYLASGELVDLIIGAEGTLGIVTRVELQLERTPATVGTLVIALAELPALGHAVAALRELVVPPAAIELLDRTFLDIAGPGASPIPLDGVRALLLVDIEGRDRTEVETALTVARRAVGGVAAHTHVTTDPVAREELWHIRHAASPVLATFPNMQRSLQVIEDGCVPVAELGAYVAGVEAAAADVDIPVIMFGHAGDGHVHVNALADTSRADCVTRLEQLVETVTALVARLGGTPSGEHGDGRLRAATLERIYGPAVTALFAEVKRAFDPAGVFNPGVVVSDGRPALADLKVGPAALPLPDPVTAALRARERAGRWDRAPLTLLDEPI